MFCPILPPSVPIVWLRPTAVFSKIHATGCIERLAVSAWNIWNASSKPFETTMSHNLCFSNRNYFSWYSYLFCTRFLLSVIKCLHTHFNSMNFYEFLKFKEIYEFQRNWILWIFKRITRTVYTRTYLFSNKKPLSKCNASVGRLFSGRIQGTRTPTGHSRLITRASEITFLTFPRSLKN